MLLTGQPLHAFDAQRIAESRIIVRCARKDERVTTLDDIERNTDQQVLLITDPKKAVAIAGVMGGANTEIDDNTDEIIIEAANFNPVNIRRTALRLGLRTEASNRFEKSLDPELTIFGLTGCVRMIRELLPDSSISSPFADAYPGHRERNVVRLNCDWASTLIGATIEKRRIVSILRSLQFDVDETRGADVEVTVPTFRSTKDVSIPQDLVEEVGRIYGYDNITPALPYIESTPPQRDEILYFTRELKRKLSGELSLTEVYTYSFLDDSLLRLFYGNGEDTFVTLKNPVSTEMSRMRRSLVCGLFGLIQKNSPLQDEFSLFEIGSVYSPRQSSKGTDDGLPHERHMASALMTQKIKKGSVFFELKGKAELLFRTLGLYGVAFKPLDLLADYPKRFDIGAVGLESAFHPGRRAIVCHGDTCFGVVAEMNPVLLKKVGMDFHVFRASFFEMDVQLLYNRVRFGRKNKKYAALARFPEVVLAFAVVVDEKVPAQEVREFIASYDSDLIEQVELFDIYRGKSLPDGKKNLAFNVFYRRKDRTLTEKEAKVVHEEIARRVRKHGWGLR
jgi:phenylalanyl-tRNA synthetase beta chain